MLTNKKIKIPISLALSLLLMVPTINAARLDEFVLSTSTSAGSWSDPLGGGKYLSGGDFKFKLRSSNAYAPLFQYRMPGIKIGCSGMSIDGGFLSFLGLDKLQDMLSNASSSLVMGIFIGLEFSLPAISAVFAKVRDWANALQGLMQNACNIGKAISKGSFGKAAFDEELDKKIGGPFSALNDALSGGQLLESVKDLAQCDGDPANPKCNLKDALNKALGNKVKKDAEKNKDAAAAGSSITANMLLGITTPSNSDIALVTNLGAVYGNSGFGCGLTVATLGEENKLFDAIKYIFFGDIGVDHETIENFIARLDDDKCGISNSVLSKEGAHTVTTGSESTFPTPKPSRIEPIISDPKDAAQFLVFGGSKINEKYNQVAGTAISIPDRKIFYLDIANERDENRNPISKTRAVYVSAKKEVMAAYTITWDGVFKESLKSIRDRVNFQTGYSAPGINYDAYDTSAVSSINAPLLIPGISRYIKVIAKQEKRANSATPETEMLKVNLAKANAILYSRELMGAMESRVLSLLDGTGGEISVLNDMARHIRETSKEIRKLLKEMEDEIGRTEFMQEFEKIEKEQRLESIKTNR